MSESLLRIEGLKVSFPFNQGLVSFLSRTGVSGIDGVADVSLSIDPGECFALVGESGSGKTTLARAVNGLAPISQGGVWFSGHALHEGNIDWQGIKRDVAMMFQDPAGSLSPRKTVGSSILEPFDIHGVPLEDRESKARELLKMTGLQDMFLDRYPHQLSGGQARRVGVARALALKPKLILADEPTAGLDVSVQGEILTLLNKLRGELNIAILIVTHNLNILRHIADRMGVMYLGRLVETGSVKQIFDHPTHPYTKALLSANPEPDPDARTRRVALSGETPSLLFRPPGCEFHPRCPWVQPDCSSALPDLTTVNDDGTHAQAARCFYPLTTE